MKQVCLEMAFPCGANTDLGMYLSGDRPDLIDFYPELALYRDIVFLFKYMMTSKVEDLPELRNWHQKHAKLQWR